MQHLLNGVPCKENCFPHTLVNLKLQDGEGSEDWKNKSNEAQSFIIRCAESLIREEQVDDGPLLLAQYCTHCFCTILHSSNGLVTCDAFMCSLWVERYKGQQVLHFDITHVHWLFIVFAHSFQSICRIPMMYARVMFHFEWVRGLTRLSNAWLQHMNLTVGLQSCGCATFRRSQKGRFQRRGRLEWEHDPSRLMVQQDKWHFVRNKYSPRNRYVVR